MPNSSRNIKHGTRTGNIKQIQPDESDTGQEPETYDEFDLKNRTRDKNQKNTTKSTGKVGHEKRTGKRVKLIGHTDDVGNTAANMDLGKRRANMIKDYLISEGVAASKIVADSQGESHPFASNNTLEGRGKNRRTELQIID